MDNEDNHADADKDNPKVSQGKTALTHEDFWDRILADNLIACRAARARVGDKTFGGF